MPKKNATTAKPAHAIVTVYMPKAMVSDVDSAAKKEHRQRSPQVVALVEEALIARKERELVASK